MWEHFQGDSSNKCVLDPVRFDDSDTIEGSSSTPANVEMTLDTEEDAAEESSGDHDDEYSDVDFDDED